MSKIDHKHEWFGMGGYPIPPPDAIVHYPDGSFAPIMFHYASEGCRPREIAEENGFDVQFVDMESVVADDDPLFIDYFESGDPDVIRRWSPPKLEGWRLVGKTDTENGPVAYYIRKCFTPVSDTGGEK